MALTSQTKTRILIGLGVVLLGVVLMNVQGGAPVAPGAAADETFRPIAIQNPALHLDRIERLRKLEYKPTGRDIFTAELPKPPEPKVVESYKPVGPQPPPPDPPLTVPFKFYGISTDTKTGKRQGFFTNGEEVYIVSEGDLVLGRYRIATIGNTSAVVEEVSSGKHATLTMESSGTPGPGGAPQEPQE
jgi:hypothetical protein